ncbi:CorA family divalent cation transporter [Desulfosporosinus meridiei]|uniref:Mg2+/Co2+ transporter n=1 Tax=Desulfosporosinus meridiei (strain ATCC BAA-275 / DSM 13257 / KCTC 12902 / NCIMB 13706 / S10) TaxID=768704 RepID=J7J2B9_DESMD|nr:CorA family divalent cation transporter [Desulfosporosinus meridiei]AFQ45126.1 Mg2+/Co2+ transporter [Desulfosporosinus meridiei DSM 13257]
MLAAYRTIDNIIINTNKPEEKGSWINLTNPTEDEIALVTNATGMEFDRFLKGALDDEERPRIETENEQILVIINVPIMQNATVIYETIPLGIILMENSFV